MSADRLRQAATVLRERAEAATPGPWSYQSTSRDERVLGQFAGMTELIAEPTDGINAAYIATMHPGVGLALAEWLDTAGADLWAHGPMCECAGGCHLCDHVGWMPHARRALRIADLILGGVS